MIRAHKNNTANFDELTYDQQVKSINAMLLNVKKAIKANIKRAEKEGKDVNEIKNKRIHTVIKMLNGLFD